MTTTHARRAAVSASAVCALLAATGCGGPAPAAPPAPAPPAYAAAVQPRLEALAEDLLVTGATVLVRSPEQGDWTMTLGTRDRDGGDPVQVGDHVRVGSNTKPWTGTVILQLVDEGALSLDDPIARFRPDVPGGEDITIRQLMGMRSGLFNYTEALELSEAQDADRARMFTPDELLAMAFTRPPLYPPGEGFNYSNTNTVLLGTVIEQVTGRPVAEEFQRRIFDPLGMTGSSLPAAEDDTLPEPHPAGYTYGSNVETIDSLVLPADVQERARAGTLAPMDVTQDNPSWAWTAGSGISTAGDLATFVEAVVEGGLISPGLQEERLGSVRPIVEDDPASAAYGLALAGFGPLYGHSGELPGYNSFMGHDPDRGITLVVWATPAPAVDGRAPAVEMAKTVIEELYGS